MASDLTFTLRLCAPKFGLMAVGLLVAMGVPWLPGALLRRWIVVDEV
jgi:hypothetical protein